MSADTLSGTGLGVLREPAAWLLSVVSGLVGIGLGILIKEPTRDTRAVVCRIAGALVFHADVHSNPGVPTREMMDEAQKVYRGLAADLGAAAASVPRWARGPLAALRLLPPHDAIGEASKDLIALSNMLHGGPYIDGLQNSQIADRIRLLLRIETVR